ncbi:hypothetical protein JCM9279_001012 [Rhodotorula babjevae]
MAGGFFHSDSDSDGAASHSDDSTSTLARSSPFDPLPRPAPRSSAVHAYLSPGRKRLQRKQYLPPSTPKPQASYSHTPWAPERPLAGGSADSELPLYHRPTHSSQHHGDPGPFLKNKLLVDPVKVLHRPLNDQWAILAKTAPAVNRAAQGLLIHERPLEVVEWNELRSHDNPVEFLELLFKKDDRAGEFAHTPRKESKEPAERVTLEQIRRKQTLSKKLTLEELSLSDRGLVPVDYFPQIERFLTNEANASEAFISNALNGVLAVAEQFLPADYLSESVHENAPIGPGIKVICSGQHALEKHADDSGNAFVSFLLVLPPLGTDASTSPGAHSTSRSRSALDLTFALVSWPPTAEPKFRFDLCIVEMKRPGYVVHDHWLGKNFHHTHKNVHAFPKALLPQVMLYNQRSGCERFVISDYLASVAVHVDHESMVHKDKAEVLVGARPITFERGTPDSPYKGGVGTAIAYELAQALKALGCVNPSLFSHLVYHDEQQKPHKVTLHESIHKFLHAHGKL